MQIAVRRRFAVCLPWLAVFAASCASSPAPTADAAVADASVADATADSPPPVAGAVVVSAAPDARTPRATPGIGTSYWQWSPTWGGRVLV